jgi:hypothetical protein
VTDGVTALASIEVLVDGWVGVFEVLTTGGGDDNDETTRGDEQAHLFEPQCRKYT